MELDELVANLIAGDKKLTTLLKQKIAQAVENLDLGEDLRRAVVEAAESALMDLDLTDVLSEQVGKVVKNALKASLLIPKAK